MAGWSGCFWGFGVWTLSCLERIFLVCLSKPSEAPPEKAGKNEADTIHSKPGQAQSPPGLLAPLPRLRFHRNFRKVSSKRPRGWEGLQEKIDPQRIGLSKLSHTAIGWCWWNENFWLMNQSYQDRQPFNLTSCEFFECLGWASACHAKTVHHRPLTPTKPSVKHHRTKPGAVHPQRVSVRKDEHSTKAMHKKHKLKTGRPWGNTRNQHKQSWNHLKPTQPLSHSNINTRTTKSTNKTQWSNYKLLNNPIKQLTMSKSTITQAKPTNKEIQHEQLETKQLLQKHHTSPRNHWSSPSTKIKSHQKPIRNPPERMFYLLFAGRMPWPAIVLGGIGGDLSWDPPLGFPMLCRVWYHLYCFCGCL